jgi:pSer/pThr/pTyr-binding forkhead associated (FHA) protein
MKTWRILIDLHEPKGERVSVIKSTGRRLIFGRSRMCDVRVPIAEISRYHCAFVVQDDGTVLAEDLGSASGSFYDGEKFSTRTIEAAKRIQVGAAEISLAARPELLHENNPQFRLSLMLENDDGTLLGRDVFDVQVGERIAVGHTPHGFRLPFAIQDADQFTLEVGEDGALTMRSARDGVAQPAGASIPVAPNVSLHVTVSEW